MKTVKTVFWFVVVVCLLLLALYWLTGCTEAQRRAVDSVAADANSLGGSLRGLADNPLVPEPVRTVLYLAGVGLVGAAAAWGKLRGKIKLLTETAGCIVQAVEESTAQVQREVKCRVEGNMNLRGIYPRANKLVDSLKKK